MRHWKQVSMLPAWNDTRVSPAHRGEHWGRFGQNLGAGGQASDNAPGSALASIHSGASVWGLGYARSGLTLVFPTPARSPPCGSCRALAGAGGPATAAIRFGSARGPAHSGMVARLAGTGMLELPSRPPLGPCCIASHGLTSGAAVG